MGHGQWSGQRYRSSTLKNIADGSTFDYSNNMMRTQPRSAWKVHEKLDPKRKNQQGDHTGQITRESLDFPEHPNTTPIVVAFDVTGSMGRIPGVIVKELPKLIDGLLAGGVPDPQVLVAAVGDSRTDTLPLQVGQFESDNRIDEQIEGLVLEGGGGGQMAEGYETMAFYLAHFTHLDSVELRGKKGYCFFLGDERPYAKLAPRWHDLTGEAAGERSIDTVDIFNTLRDSFETYFLYMEQGGYNWDRIVKGGRGHTGQDAESIPWNEVVGENAVSVKDATHIVDVIVNTIKVHEARHQLA